MMIPMRKSCADCIYYSHPDQRAVFGLCRRRPPVTVTNSDSCGQWPGVMDEDWCGEFDAGEAPERWDE